MQNLYILRQNAEEKTDLTVFKQTLTSIPLVPTILHLSII